MIDVQSVKSDLKVLSNEVKDLSNSFREMEGKMNELYNSIVGNSKLGFQGIVDRVSTLEKKIEKSEKQVISYKGTIIGFSAGFASIFTIAFELLKAKFFK
jgi:hypothetical protein